MQKPSIMLARYAAALTVARLSNYPGPMIRHIDISAPPSHRQSVVCRDLRWHEETPLAKIRFDTSVPELERPALKEQMISGFRIQAQLDIMETLAGAVVKMHYVTADWHKVDRGHLAQLVACLYDRPDHESDLGIVRPRLLWLHPEDAENHFHQYWLWAMNRVQSHWEDVGNLAALLIEEQYLEYDDVMTWWDNRQLQAA